MIIPPHRSHVQQTEGMTCIGAKATWAGPASGRPGSSCFDAAAKGLVQSGLQVASAAEEMSALRGLQVAGPACAAKVLAAAEGASAAQPASGRPGTSCLGVATEGAGVKQSTSGQRTADVASTPARLSKAFETFKSADGVSTLARLGDK